MLFNIEVTDTELCHMLTLLERHEWPAYTALIDRLNLAINSYLVTIGKKRLYGGDIVDLEEN